MRNIIELDPVGWDGKGDRSRHWFIIFARVDWERGWSWGQGSRDIRPQGSCVDVVDVEPRYLESRNIMPPDLKLG
jgi:hypothetical protein